MLFWVGGELAAVESRSNPVLPYGPADERCAGCACAVPGGPWQIAPTTFLACSPSTPSLCRGESFRGGSLGGV